MSSLSPSHRSLCSPVFVRLAATAVVASVLGLVLGCGDLSQEDLLFRAGVPTKEAVAVVPPGSESEVAQSAEASALTGSTRQQGLDEVCDGNLLCESRNISRNFNGLTFLLLDIVDGVLALPPTLREPGRRVWGPHFDERKGQSFRFEMVRIDDETFRFCLHASSNRVRLRDVENLDCDVDEDASGLANLFSGTFSPSGINGDAAREGAGTMHLESARMSRLNREERFADSVDFVFDNTDGTNIHIDVLGAAFETTPRDATYDYDRRSDESGEMRFELFANFIRGGGLFQDDALEHVTLGAKWQADRSGRAEGVVDGGDAEEQVFTIEQCWGSDLALVFDKDVGGEVVGDEGACVFGPLSAP